MKEYFQYAAKHVRKYRYNWRFRQCFCMGNLDCDGVILRAFRREWLDRTYYERKWELTPKSKRARKTDPKITKLLNSCYYGGRQYL